jgi:hypothetical protein
MPWLAVAAIGAAAVSGVAGAIANSNAANRADMLRNEAIKKWLSVNIPDPEKQKLALQQFVVAGKLTPELEQAIKQDPSAWQGVVQDQGLKQSQLRSLRSLEDLGSGKETFDDQAAHENAMIDEAAAERGHQKAITSSLAQRGQLGTGLELTARMGQQQADADTAAKTALGLEAGRRANALKAIQGAGVLAGQMSQQDLALKGEKANAADTISRFNTENLRDVNAANAHAKNAAQQFNLTNQQGIANKNTALNNYEQQYNKELQQQQFEDQAKVAAGETGQYNAAAAGATEAGKNAASFWGNIAGQAPKLINAAGNYFGDDEEEKKKKNLWAGGDSTGAFGNIA